MFLHNTFQFWKKHDIFNVFMHFLETRWLFNLLKNYLYYHLYSKHKKCALIVKASESKIRHLFLPRSSYTNETTTTNKMTTKTTATTMGTTPTIQQQLPLLDDLNSGAILFAPRDIIYLIFLALQTFWVCRISEPICKPCNDVYTK